MYNEQRARKNFIDGLISLSTSLDFKTKKDLKDYLWKKKDFYSLEIISDEEQINENFLNECALID